ncbi:MAG: D-alanine-D-alanine ligase/ATP-grasp enzyme-like protein [Myxococcales bacterium]|nr:D-alanine-D-alanine ligase/ATP-grasp enzyme-like protein [Myxococcales bacterium]
MRLALTFNRKRDDREADAELDTLETVHTLASTIASLGHTVMPIEVSGSIEALVRTLRRTAPDLVFNIAEGTHGRFREAFYPALFEQLGLAHTGSDACVLAVCLDKALAKRIVSSAGVAVPRDHVLRAPIADLELTFPVIVKPNYEGSSKGITQASVVTERAQLRSTIERLLATYPSGLLVEELIDGDDVSVAFVAGLGVLPPVRYLYEPTGPHRILDFELKHGVHRVRLEVPATLDAATTASVTDAATRAFDVLGVTGFGRADFRITPGGEVRFLEMNPLPSLASRDAELFVSAAERGVNPGDMLAAIIASGKARRARSRAPTRARRARAA